ncbi:MAG: RHS repeat-associated core domain-containing protein, partial [Thermoplasmata archaeon]
MISAYSALENRYLFTSREWDEETGLYYYRARYYAPEIGRFLSQDPLINSGIVNLYVYVDCDPVNSIDPTGEDLIFIPAAPRFERFMDAFGINGRYYPYTRYDPDCIARLVREFEKAYEKLEQDARKMARELERLQDTIINQWNKANRDFAINMIFNIAAIAASIATGGLAGIAIGVAIAGGKILYNELSGSATSSVTQQGMETAVGTTVGHFTGEHLSDMYGKAVGNVLGKGLGVLGGMFSSVLDILNHADTIEGFRRAMKKIKDELTPQLRDWVRETYNTLLKALQDAIEKWCKRKKIETPSTTTVVDDTATEIGHLETPPSTTAPPSTSGDASTTGVDHRDVGIHIDSDDPPIGVEVPILVEVTNNGFDTTENISLHLKVFKKNVTRDILLVADESDGANMWFEEALNALNITYDIVFVDTEYTPVFTDGNTSTKDLEDYDVILWECSNDASGTLNGSDRDIALALPPGLHDTVFEHKTASLAQQELEKFLDDGGCLFVGGEGIMKEWPQTSGTLMSDYMFANGYGTDTFDLMTDGVPGTIGDGLSLALSGGNGSNFELNSSSIHSVKPGGQVDFLFECGIAGIEADTGKNKTVLFAYDFDSIALFLERTLVMKRILDFLDCRYGDGNGTPEDDQPNNGCPPITPGHSTTVPLSTVFTASGDYTVEVVVMPGGNYPENDIAVGSKYVPFDDARIDRCNIYDGDYVTPGAHDVIVTLANHFVDRTFDTSIILQRYDAYIWVDEEFDDWCPDTNPCGWTHFADPVSNYYWEFGTRWTPEGDNPIAFLYPFWLDEPIDTYLISPPCDLTGTELSFLYASDFSGENHTLEVKLALNAVAPYSRANFTETLLVLDNSSQPNNNWSAPLVIDLSPYVGNTVNIAFFYNSTNGSAA